MNESKEPLRNNQGTSVSTEVELQACRKMMDLVAIRAHSEQELREKLQKNFETDEVEKAIGYGKAQGWIPKNQLAQQLLAKQLAEGLHRKFKGIEFINHYLSEKGLPTIETETERELEKATALLENKFAKTETWNSTAVAKASRFLAARGFEMSVIEEVVVKRSTRF